MRCLWFLLSVPIAAQTLKLDPLVADHVAWAVDKLNLPRPSE